MKRTAAFVGTFIFILFCFVPIVRTTVVNWYHISSGSMMPTLIPDTKVFGNLMAYDLKVPFTGQKIFSISLPSRGDIIVFKHPDEPSTKFISRIIGIPGDVVSWDGMRLKINDQLVEAYSVPYEESGINRIPANLFNRSPTDYRVISETLNDRPHRILVLGSGMHMPVDNLKIPQDSYFVMGDNRDNSSDSRLWGFVPRANIIGKIIN